MSSAAVDGGRMGGVAVRSATAEEEERRRATNTEVDEMGGAASAELVGEGWAEKDRRGPLGTTVESANARTIRIDWAVEPGWLDGRAEHDTDGGCERGDTATAGVTSCGIGAGLKCQSESAERCDIRAGTRGVEVRVAKWASAEVLEGKRTAWRRASSCRKCSGRIELDGNKVGAAVQGALTGAAGNSCPLTVIRALDHLALSTNSRRAGIFQTRYMVVQGLFIEVIRKTERLNKTGSTHFETGGYGENQNDGGVVTRSKTAPRTVNATTPTVVAPGSVPTMTTTPSAAAAAQEAAMRTSTVDGDMNGEWNMDSGVLVFVIQQLMSTVGRSEQRLGDIENERGSLVPRLGVVANGAGSTDATSTLAAPPTFTTTQVEPTSAPTTTAAALPEARTNSSSATLEERTAAGTPAASATANTVVASSATTRSYSASPSVVTSTVTTSSSPKRTMSLGDYKKARGNALFARDELEALFDIGSDADMEDEEENEETSSTRRDDPSVGSRRPRKDDSDTSSSKRSCSGSDRPLADAGPLSSPRRCLHHLVLWRRALDQCATHGCRLQARSNLASAVLLRRVSTHCTRAVASKTMMSLRNSTLIWRRIKDAITTSDSSMSSDGTGIIRLPVEAECPNGRHSVKAGVPLLKTSTKTTLATVSVLRASLIAQRPSSAAGGRSTLSGAVGDHSSRSSFTPFGGFGGGGLRTPSPFPERPAPELSAAPTYRGPEEILSNEYENDLNLGSGSDDQQFAGRSSELPPLRLAVGMEAAGRRPRSGPPDSVDRLAAV
ncbi:unnamed protein product [Phytophthora fragariaefolia]|uniref:Unnamed protein product n=1 Tax=Phytophthora fragariaefolia TaxID=1490495 RepID=A0A9W6U6C3_9STRA|nr:unnamed protein product [Phytophthora fragariaefolia]